MAEEQWKSARQTQRSICSIEIQILGGHKRGTPKCYDKTPLDGHLLREVPLVHLSNKTIKQWVHLGS